ncbi:MAG TPA: hypothetical protein PK636_01260 [bacterium]|nr:hypothetical protein [bacterium]HPJ71294.1 hypothetical protein [bacterium]HPQ66986.1 hypothetical protein [bacterium]
MKHGFRRAAAAAAGLVLLGAPAAGAPLPPECRVAGLDRREWGIRWWNWAQSAPAWADPAADRTGRWAGVGQRGPVWFVAGTRGGEPVWREFSVPTGRYLFFPLIAFFRCGAGECERARRSVTAAMESAEGLFCSIDGRPVPNPERFRAECPSCFPSPRCREGDEGTGTGYWIMLEPLSPGTHTLRFGGRLGRISIKTTCTVRVVETLEGTVSLLRELFPGHFLPDIPVLRTDLVDRPTVYGEPDPPEGFAGPDPSGRLPSGIYLPPRDPEFFTTDISLEQWVFHEMFHLRNRRTGEYDRFIVQAFPDENDPLVQWMLRDPYHRALAREEAFINLITFADPARTDRQRKAVREWFDYIGADRLSFPEIRRALAVVAH